jgi:HAD superfamily hydrolase (TIGR01509 family)
MGPDAQEAAAVAVGSDSRQCGPQARRLAQRGDGGERCSPPPALQAVLFDMDGLLVDTEPIWFEVERMVMARLGSDWAAADQQALVGGSLQRSVDYLISRSARPEQAPEFGVVAGWLVGGMADLLATREIEPMPGAVALIDAVAAAGLPYALVTSSERVIADAVLKALARRGIGFDVIVSGADVSQPKPDPEPYRLAAALVGADPRCCVALEDSPNGVGSALAAGCVTVAVPGLVPITARPGLLIVNSLADLDLDRLRSLVAAR